LNANGSFTYTPDGNFSGQDSFTYNATDGIDDSNVANVTISVTAVNDPPVANDDNATTNEGTEISIAVLSNDTDIDSASLTITKTDSSGTQGTPTIVTDLNGILPNNITFTPSANFFGITSFNYTIFDGEDGFDTATVTVEVIGGNDDPIASNDTQAIPKNSGGVTIDVLRNDIDADGDTLSVDSVNTTGTNGTALNNGNNITYTPHTNFTGTDTFTYVASDGNGGTSNNATVTITVAVLEISLNAEQYQIEHGGIILVTDSSANTNGTIEEIIATIISNSSAGFSVTLTETSNTTGVFSNNEFVVFTAEATDSTINHLNVAAGDTVTVSYRSVNDTATIFDDTGLIQSEGIPVNAAERVDCGFGEDGDNDGLCNIWESGDYVLEDGSENIRGIDIFEEEIPQYIFDCGTVDSEFPVCPVTSTPDVFVEIDYMTGHRPSDEAIKLVKAAFSQSKVGVAGGINLHILVDDDIGFHTNEISFTKNTGDSDFDQIKRNFFGTVAERALAVGGDPILDAKRQVFHYILFAHERTDNIGESGRAEVGGNDILITLASYAGGIGTTDQQAGTVMHELGHNLGLLHGGPDTDDNTELPFRVENCKPNYLSVMSYARQFAETTPGRDLDYSQLALAALDENSLNEPAGVELYTPSTDELISYGNPKLTSLTGVAIDWNRVAPNFTETNASADINNLGIAGCNTDSLDELRSYEDWSSLLYNFRGNTGHFADGIHTSDDSLEEIVFDALVGLRSAQIPIIVEAINALDGAVFADGNSRSTLIFDLIQIESLINQNLLEEALQALAALRQKMDGSGDDDLITDSGARAKILPLVDTLRTSLLIATTPANKPPVANNDIATTSQAISIVIPVLANDADPEGDSLILLSATIPSNGTTAINLDNTTITYTPASTFVGVDTFAYIITDDASEGSDNATGFVEITVQDITPPTITAPADVIAEATGLQTAVDIGTATATDTVDPSPVITNNATAGFPLGNTTVTYTATDSSGNTATATQLVTIEDNTPPSSSSSSSSSSSCSFAFNAASHALK